MAILTAILNSTHFVDGAENMASSIDYLIDKLDYSYRAMQKFEATILTFSGSSNQASSDLASLLDNSNRLGVSFEDAVTPFAKFASAADGLSKSQVFGIFDSFATALSAVRANGSEVNGVFLALQQIVSKGKLSMEELRLQLAERIPGAMKMAAQAAGMSMAEFEKAVKNGTVNTNEWLIKFSDLLKNNFSDAAELASKSWDAAVTRMKNSSLVFNADLVKMSDSGTIWSKTLDLINDGLLNSSSVFSSTGIMTRNFSEIMYNLATTVLPLVPKALEFLSGATNLLSRAMAFLSTTANTLYTSISLGNTIFLEAKKAIYEFLNPVSASKEKILEMDAAIVRSKLNTMSYVENTKNALMTLTAPWEEVARKVAITSEEVKKADDAVSDRMKTLKEYAATLNSSLAEQVKGHEKATDEEKAAYLDMYKTAGFGANKFYDSEAQKLVEQVAEWQKYGADVYESNQWLYTELEKLSAEAWSKGQIEAGQAMDSYSAMYTTLVDQFNRGNDNIKRQVNEMSSSIDGLNAKDIDIKARLDGGAVISGINGLISKFKELQAAANAANAARAQSSAYSSYDSATDGNYSDWNDERNSYSEYSSATRNATGATTTVNNFSQQLSRSDISNILINQQRLNSRV